MRYFTPDLFARYNSADEAVADEADAEWEAALAAYRAHLDAVRGELPPPVRELAELCLHDAELLGDRPADPSVAVVMLSQQGSFVVLVYSLWEQVREQPAPPDWPFSKQRTHWLYDELDIARGAEGRFLHRVLLSDGRALEIPFRSVILRRIPAPQSGVPVRQSA